MPRVAVLDFTSSIRRFGRRPITRSIAITDAHHPGCRGGKFSNVGASASNRQGQRW